MSALEDLDDVPWATLRHAYGTAEDVPGLLRTITAADETAAGAAVAHLSGLLVHQACVYPATAAVLRFLVALAAQTPWATVRGALLNDVAAGAMCEGTELERPDGVRLALGVCSERVLPFLGDDDAFVRTMAATALGHADPPSLATAREVRARLDLETDVRVLPALVATAARCDPTAARSWLPDVYRHDAPAVRAAALYATAVNAVPWTAEATDALLTCWPDEPADRRGDVFGLDPLPQDMWWQWDLEWWPAALLDHLPGWHASDLLRQVDRRGNDLTASALREAAEAAARNRG